MSSSDTHGINSSRHGKHSISSRNGETFLKTSKDPSKINSSSNVHSTAGSFLQSVNKSAARESKIKKSQNKYILVNTLPACARKAHPELLDKHESAKDVSFPLSFYNYSCWTRMAKFAWRRSLTIWRNFMSANRFSRSKLSVSQIAFIIRRMIQSGRRA